MYGMTVGGEGHPGFRGSCGQRLCCPLGGALCTAAPGCCAVVILTPLKLPSILLLPQAGAAVTGAPGLLPVLLQLVVLLL